MGTVIFVILRAARIFDNPTMDWTYGCMLISLDSIAFALFSLGSTMRSCLNPAGKTSERETVLGSEDETKTDS